MPLEINADYVIRRTILFDNKCGFALGENPKAPAPYVTWQFNEQDGTGTTFGAIITINRIWPSAICATGPRTTSGAIMC